MNEKPLKPDAPELLVESNRPEIVVPPGDAPEQPPAVQPVQEFSSYYPLGQSYKNTRSWLFQSVMWDVFAVIVPLTGHGSSGAAGVFMSPLMALMAFGTLLTFMREALLNLQTYGVRGLEYGWKDVNRCWWLPPENLWAPYRVMLEIWRGSSPAVDNLDVPAAAADIRRIRRWWMPALIGYVGCWIPFFAACMWSAEAGRSLFLIVKEPPTSALIYWGVFFLFRLFAAVQLNGILKEITHRQMHKLRTDSNQMIH